MLLNINNCLVLVVSQNFHSLFLFTFLHDDLPFFYMSIQVSNMVVQEDPSGEEGSIHRYVSFPAFASNIWQVKFFIKLKVFYYCNILYMLLSARNTKYNINLSFE